MEFSEGQGQAIRRSYDWVMGLEIEGPRGYYYRQQLFDLDVQENSCHTCRCV